MKLSLIVMTILINFLNPLFVKSEGKIGQERNNTENRLYLQLSNNDISETSKIHIVKEGETISSISKDYSLNKKLIIK